MHLLQQLILILEIKKMSWRPKWKSHEKSDFWEKLIAEIPDEEPEDYLMEKERTAPRWLNWGMKKWIKYECDYEHKVVYITWNRPEKLNAGCPYPAAWASKMAREDPDCKAIVMRGSGRGFSAGYDITPVVGFGQGGRRPGYGTGDRGEFESAAERFSLTFREYYKCDFLRGCLWDNPLPIIGVVHGFCIAGGNDVLSRCDIIFADEDALFGYNILRGRPLPAMHTFSPWLFGMRKSKEICFTGNLISAQDAYDCGYVNKVLPHEELEEYSDMIAREMAALPRVTISLSKRAINHYYDSIGKRTQEDYCEAMRALASTWMGKDENDYGSDAWRKATMAKGLSYHLRERGKPFVEADRWWREKYAARPKYEKGSKEDGWASRPEVVAELKKQEKVKKKEAK
jgi:enoyl-CoA hydratase